MTTVEKVRAEISRLDAILARRGQFYEDEQVRHTAMVDVEKWLVADKEESDRIEAESVAAESVPIAPGRKDIQSQYEGYKNKPKNDGRMGR